MEAENGSEKRASARKGRKVKTRLQPHVVHLTPCGAVVSVLLIPTYSRSWIHCSVGVSEIIVPGAENPRSSCLAVFTPQNVLPRPICHTWYHSEYRVHDTCRSRMTKKRKRSLTCNRPAIALADSPAREAATTRARMSVLYIRPEK